MGRTNLDQEKKRKIHYSLRHLMDKYEKMATKMGTSSSIENLLNNTDLPYSIKKMMVPLLSKFKVPQMKLYDGSKDSVKHLETFFFIEMIISLINRK